MNLLTLIPKSLKSSLVIWGLGYAIDELDGTALARKLRQLTFEKFGGPGEKQLIEKAKGFVAEFQVGLNAPATIG